VHELVQAHEAVPRAVHLHLVQRLPVLLVRQLQPQRTEVGDDLRLVQGAAAVGVELVEDLGHLAVLRDVGLFLSLVRRRGVRQRLLELHRRPQLHGERLRREINWRPHW